MKEHFILASADGNKITTKTKLDQLLVYLDTPLVEGQNCIFLYDRSQLTDPNSVNIPGIFMFIDSLTSYDDGYTIIDGQNRTFYLKRSNL